MFPYGHPAVIRKHSQCTAAKLSLSPPAARDVYVQNLFLDETFFLMQLVQWMHEIAKANSILYPDYENKFKHHLICD